MSKRVQNSWARHDPNAFVFLNKNFCNYPLARDPRVKPEWKLKKKALRAKLSGDDRITFELPASVDAALKRFPTPFDMNVLCALLVQARIGKSTKIAFASYSEVLRAMGFAVSSTNLRRLRSSIAFLSVVTIQYARYWFSGRTIKSGAPKYDIRREQPWSAGLYKEGYRGAKRLLPLIERSTENEDGLRFSLNTDWLKANGTRFVARVHLPLPRDAAAQNIVLCALARRHDKGPRFQRGEYEGHSAKLRAFCRKVGLNHSRRTIKLRTALAAAQDYFLKNSRDMLWAIENNRVTLVMAETKQREQYLNESRPKRKATGKKQKPRPRQYPFLRSDPDCSTKTVFDEEGQTHQISYEEYERDFG